MDFGLRVKTRKPTPETSLPAEINRELRAQLARLRQEEVTAGSTSERTKDN